MLLTAPLLRYVPPWLLWHYNSELKATHPQSPLSSCQIQLCCQKPHFYSTYALGTVSWLWCHLPFHPKLPKYETPDNSLAYKIQNHLCSSSWSSPLRSLLGTLKSALLTQLFLLVTVTSNTIWASLVAQLVKNLPAMQETLVQFLGREDSLEKGTATHSSILGLPWWLRWQRIHLQWGRPKFDPWLRKIPWRRERLPTPVFLGFPGGSAGKESTCNVGDLGSIPGLGRSPEEGNSYPLQYSGLENSMDCIVHGVARSRTRLSDFHFRETRDYGRSCQATLWYCYFFVF